MYAIAISDITWHETAEQGSNLNKADLDKGKRKRNFGKTLVSKE